MIALHAFSCICNVKHFKFVVVLIAVWFSVLKVNLYIAYNFIEGIHWSCPSVREKVYQCN